MKPESVSIVTSFEVKLVEDKSFFFVLQMTETDVISIMSDKSFSMFKLAKFLSRFVYYLFIIFFFFCKFGFVSVHSFSFFFFLFLNNTYHLEYTNIKVFCFVYVYSMCYCKSAQIFAQWASWGSWKNERVHFN